MKIVRIALSLIVYVSITGFQPPARVRLVVLGTLQDGGSPHIGCNKNCCKKLFAHPDARRKVVALGVIDPKNKQTWLFEATPDMATQVKMLKKAARFQQKELPDGIFLTHAHIGHYTGLMYLSKEAINSKSEPVFAMPRMKDYLEHNGPWSQLVTQNNIDLALLQNEATVKLSNQIKVTPIAVPHRDEFSETVGYRLEGPHKKVLFIPDINKWALWDHDLVKEILSVDYAFLDGTFYSGKEIRARNIAEIPHPFIVETMNLLAKLPAKQKAKVHFIHFNHTNPVINPNSKEAATVVRNGFKIAKFGEMVSL